MLEKVERTLASGLKPAEEIGRWGDDEFLVLSHERNAAMLAAHAQTLAGLARTTDFRWWGDRVSLTVSIGAAQAERGERAQRIAGAGAGRDVRERAGRGKSHYGSAGETSMFAIIGIVIVFGAVIGGFLMEKGHIAVLVQPAELLIIAGAATGTLLVANPLHILKGILAGLKGVLSGSKFGKQRYLNLLKMMYHVSEQGAQRRIAER